MQMNLSLDIIAGSQLWAWIVLAALLLTAAVTDVRSQKVYNWTTYPAIAVAIIGHTLTGGLSGYGGAMGLSGCMLGIIAGFLPMLAIWLLGGMGAGDVKLMAAVGALAGVQFVLAGMFYGLLVAFVMAIIVIIRRRIARSTLRRVWTFLLLVFTPTRPADPATAESPKIPFGFALCVGAMLAVAEVIVNGKDAPKIIFGI